MAVKLVVVKLYRAPSGAGKCHRQKAVVQDLERPQIKITGLHMAVKLVVVKLFRAPSEAGKCHHQKAVVQNLERPWM